MNNFENYLREHKSFMDYCAERFILDDDMPDAFDKWLTELQVDDLIKYADDFVQTIVARLRTCVEPESPVETVDAVWKLIRELE